MRIANLCLLLFTACQVALPPAAVAPGHGLQRVWIETLGLEWVPWIKAVADGLRRLDGVANVEVDLQRNVCTVTPDPDRLLDLAGLPAAVRTTPYTPGRMWLQARGKLNEREGGRWLTVDNTDLAIRLDGARVDGPAVVGVVDLGPPITLAEGLPPQE